MKEYNEKTLMEFVRNNNLKTAADVTEKFKEMYKDVINVMLENEMSEHLGYEKYERGQKELPNSRNGSNEKSVKSTFGNLLVNVPRDREGTFDPVVVERYSRSISSDIEQKIISMYSKGMSTRDISDHVKEIYGIEVSAEMVSRITDQVIELAKEWQARPLDAVYPFIFLDAIHYSVKTDSKILKRAAYVVLGVNLEGRKDVLGIYVGENETSKFWLMVLSDLKNRGVRDIFIVSVDGLNGFKEAINSVFPRSEIQRCIVHQIRNTLKYVPWKDRKEFARDLKEVYEESTEKQGYENLLQIEEKWGSKYYYAIKSWKENWAELSTFYAYTPEIRKIIYTTNAVESLHRQYRKVSKTKTVFPTDESLLKILFLATKDITKKWTNSIRDWTIILGQLNIHFGDRL